MSEALVAESGAEPTMPLQSAVPAPAPSVTENLCEVNPRVSVEQFAEHPEAAFWIGKTAVGGLVVNDEFFAGLAQFRANVYVHKLGFLPEDTLDEQGRELDADDYRSLNVAVVEQFDTDEGKAARIVGSGRLIRKDTEENVLPVEHYFPEIFTDGAIPVGDVEVSRFISQHPDRMTQHKVALAIIRAMTFNALEQKAETYCLIEKPLVGLLQFIGIPLELLAEAKDVPEYGGVLYPVRIKPQDVLDSVTSDKSGAIGLQEFFNRESNSLGEGFYPETLVGEV